jgi:hypothetical protein
MRRDDYAALVVLLLSYCTLIGGVMLLIAR